MLVEQVSIILIKVEKWYKCGGEGVVFFFLTLFLFSACFPILDTYYLGITNKNILILES